MKKYIFILLSNLSLIFTVNAQWSGTNPIYTNSKVGIGTDSPSTNLEIKSGLNNGTNPPIFRLTSKDLNAVPNQLLGEIQFYNMDLDGEHLSSYIKGLAAETYGRKGQLVFGTSGINSSDAIERMRINENGYLGIGTAIPQSILNIKNNANGSVIILERYSPNSLLGGIRFTTGYDNYNNWGGIESYGTGGLDQQDLRFYTSYGTRSERMRITEHGNVGIGTVSPNAMLDIKGNLSNRVLDLRSVNDKLMLTVNTSSHFPYLEMYSSDGATLINKINTNGVSYFNGGNVGIGTTATGTHKLAVDGTIGAREIVVETGEWSDFVFSKDYELKDLEEVEGFIEENNHLPDIPSEKEVLENGIQVGEMNAKLLQKIEELTLYMIDVNKRMNSLETENTELKKKIELLETTE